MKKNMPLMTIEAMKMETTVTSRVSGLVDKIYVSEGDEVNQDALLVSFILDEEKMKNVTHPELPEMDLSTLYEDDLKPVSFDVGKRNKGKINNKLTASPGRNPAFVRAVLETF